jgi:hypothetical protein
MRFFDDPPTPRGYGIGTSFRAPSGNNIRLTQMLRNSIRPGPGAEPVARHEVWRVPVPNVSLRSSPLAPRRGGPLRDGGYGQDEERTCGGDGARQVSELPAVAYIGPVVRWGYR